MPAFNSKWNSRNKPPSFTYSKIPRAWSFHVVLQRNVLWRSRCRCRGLPKVPFIAENSSNQRNLFSATKRLLNQGHEVPFPLTSDKLVLANEMGSSFVEKINTTDQCQIRPTS